MFADFDEKDLPLDSNLIIIDVQLGARVKIEWLTIDQRGTSPFLHTMSPRIRSRQSREDCALPPQE